MKIFVFAELSVERLYLWALWPTSQSDGWGGHGPHGPPGSYAYVFMYQCLCLCTCSNEYMKPIIYLLMKMSKDDGAPRLAIDN